MTIDLDAIVDQAVDQLDESTPDVRTAAHRHTYVDAVPVRSIRADHTYQRELVRSRVARMVAEFDSSLLGVIEVSRRDDDTYAVIDGQHRLEAARIARGRESSIACNIHTGLTVEEEAQLFFDIDRKRVRLTGWARWNARRGAGEQLVLDETLQIVLEAWPDEMDALRAEIVHGVALVLAYYPADELDRARLIAGLRRLVARQVTARAAALRETQKGEMPRLVGRILIDLYNAEPGKKAIPFAKRVPSQSKSTLKPV